MTYLIDTNVISELSRPQPDERVRVWFAHVALHEQWLSAVTVAELRAGIEKLRHADPPDLIAAERYRSNLEDQLLPGFAGRVLGVDDGTWRVWAGLTGQAKAEGRGAPALDFLLAAQALQHDLTLVTRNEKHLTGTGARLLNPWSEEPSGYGSAPAATNT